MWTELTQLSGEKILVNLDNVESVRKSKVDVTSVLLLKDGKEMGVLESRNNIRQVLMRKKVFYPI